MIRPTGDKIVVKIDPVIANNAGLIIAPDVTRWRGKNGAIEGENRGTIVAVGPGKATSKGVIMPMDAKPGDVIRFCELEYHNWKEDGDMYVLISEQDILWVEEPETIN